MKKNKITYFLTFILLLPIVYIVISDFYVEQYIENNGIHRVVTIEKIEYIGKNSKNWMIFSYHSTKLHYGRVYIDDNTTKIYKSKIGKRFVVKMSDKEWMNKIFKSYRIIQNIYIPDSIKTSPPNGWKELPEWAVR